VLSLPFLLSFPKGICFSLLLLHLLLALAFVLVLAFAVILSASFEREESRESFDHLNRSNLLATYFASALASLFSLVLVFAFVSKIGPGLARTRQFFY
jgi:uncharacterized membrane protein